MTRNESLWLVKSSGRILGPFSTEKVVELLRTREVSVLDEVAPPLRRWQTIQYHDEFRDTVESLRKATLSERTEANWTTTNTGNLTQTVTDLSGSGELTDEITNDMPFTATGKEIVIHNLDEVTGKIQSPPSGGRFQPSQVQNTAIQRQVDKTTRGLWVVTALILAVVAAFILNKRYSDGGFEARPSLQTLKSSVIAHVQVGRYTEALKELKSYFADPAQAGELGIYYGALLIQVDGQTVVGRRLLNQVLSSGRPEVKQAHTGLAVADLVDGQLDPARDNLQKALAMDSEYSPALVNLSSVYLQKGDYARAKSMAKQALRQNPSQGEALLNLAETQLYLYNVDRNESDLAAVASAVREFVDKKWDYSAEAGFYALYFDILQGARGFESRLQSYLDRDPKLTDDHRHNVFIYKGRTQWKALARLCEQLAEKAGDSPRVLTLLASCHAREQRWDLARRDIERAVHQSPKDPLIQAWYSYILRESGDAEQSSVVLGRAIELNRKGEFALPWLLQARFCQANNDFACARDSFQKMYENNLDDLTAVSGLASVHAQAKNYAEAIKLIDKGLRLSPDYTPLLALRQRAEREGWYATN